MSSVGGLMTPLCTVCAKPVADGSYVCSNDWERLERDLGDITFLAEELDLTISRQTASGAQSFGRRSVETPVVFNVQASEVAADLKQILVSWTMLIVEERGASTPADTLTAVGRFVLGHQAWLRHHPAASDALSEITGAVSAARRAVDRSPDRLYAGPCDPTGEFHTLAEGMTPELLGPCLTDLYAAAGKKLVTCPRCQLPWHVTDRREYLVEAAQDQLVTAYALSRFLTAYGEPLTNQRIGRLALAGHISPHGCDPRGNALYRVSEVIEALSRITELRRKKAS